MRILQRIPSLTRYRFLFGCIFVSSFASADDQWILRELAGYPETTRIEMQVKHPPEIDLSGIRQTPSGLEVLDYYQRGQQVRQARELHELKMRLLENNGQANSRYNYRTD